MEFDPTSIAVGGVQLIVLVFGLVEFIKAQFSGMSGKGVTLVSALLGAFLAAVFFSLGSLPPEYRVFVEIGVKSLAFGLSASGYYKFIDARTEKQ